MNATRHRASTSMYSLTFRVRVATPPMWAIWNGARSRRVHVIAGEGSLRMRSVRVQHACGGPDGLPLGSAFP